jgi:hypothetical protein
VKTPVTLSGLLVEAEPVSHATDGPVLSDLVPVAATARRTFAATDRVRGFVRVYQGLTRAAMPGYITAEIRDTTDRIVLRQESRVVTDQLGASRAVDFTVDLPVARLAAGEYLLSVEARHGNETARRQARFTVR